MLICYMQISEMQEHIDENSCTYILKLHSL